MEKMEKAGMEPRAGVESQREIGQNYLRYVSTSNWATFIEATLSGAVTACSTGENVARDSNDRDRFGICLAISSLIQQREDKGAMCFDPDPFSAHGIPFIIDHVASGLCRLSSSDAVLRVAIEILASRRVRLARDHRTYLRGTTLRRNRWIAVRSKRFRSAVEGKRDRGRGCEVARKFSKINE